MNTMNTEEEKFLKEYDSSKYEKPSVTTDVLVFTINEKNKLCLLLVRRGGHPFKGHWAIPGGFVDIRESIEDAARRELKEETNLENIYMEQLYTFGSVDRDPRMRVISVVYMALVPKQQLKIAAGDDAADAQLFEVSLRDDRLVIQNSKEGTISGKDLAFDHEEVVTMGIGRLQGKLDYTDIAFDLLKNKKAFTIYEMKRICEAILEKELETSNYRRDFLKRYVKSGKVVETNEKTTEHSKRATTVYAWK